MLRATTSRQGLLTVAYDVRLDGRPVTTWTARTWEPERTLTIDGRAHVLRARGIGEFRLTGEHEAAAGRSGRHWDVTVGDDGGYRLARAGLARRFTLEHDGHGAGSLWRSGALRPSYTADLPEDLPAAVQVFLLWIAMAVWRRTAAAASAGAAATG